MLRQRPLRPAHGIQLYFREATRVWGMLDSFLPTGYLRQIGKAVLAQLAEIAVCNGYPKILVVRPSHRRLEAFRSHVAASAD